MAPIFFSAEGEERAEEEIQVRSSSFIKSIWFKKNHNNSGRIARSGVG